MISRRLLPFLLAAACLGADKPYVLLVSLDGFRYDYAEKFGAKNLLALRDAGASVDGLIPVFPSTTFPNHYTIVTGLYPARHGIVDNSFWDPARGEKYFFKDSKFSTDGSWYGGVPLWVVAEKGGIRSAAMFWPGSDAAIAGVRPTFYSPYDGNVTNDDRVSRVLGWLALPEEKRPHLMTLYFDDVDKAGHKYGPDAPETRAAVARIDAAIGRLAAGLRATGLPVNLLVVSDHGMLKLNPQPLYLGEMVDLTGFGVATNGPNAMLYSQNKAKVTEAYEALKRRSTEVEVFRGSEVPERFRYAGSDRIGDLLVIAKGPVVLLAGKPTGKPIQLAAATHGFDPDRYPEMRGIFYAAGPDIQSGVRLAPLQNVHVYPFVLKLLGLTPPAGIDGRFEAMAPAYKAH